MRGTSPLIAARSHKTKICIHIHPIDCLIIPSICFILQKYAVVKDLNIDDPPPPPFLLLQDLQDSHDILNYKFKRFEFEDDFFSMDDKYHLTF